MNYQSTRNHRLQASSAAAVLEGIAADGGLYIRDDLSTMNFDWKGLLGEDSLTMSARILSALLPDIPDMETLVKQGYEGKFETDELTPLAQVGDRYVLELFRGPTSAFKDVALSLLPRLITSAKTVCGVDDEIVILTATSGDTGKAAHRGLPRRARHPHHRLLSRTAASPPCSRRRWPPRRAIERPCVCAVRGNFDDAQTGVKSIFAACQDRDLHGAAPVLRQLHQHRPSRAAGGVLLPRLRRPREGRAHPRIGDAVHYAVPDRQLRRHPRRVLSPGTWGCPSVELVCASERQRRADGVPHHRPSTTSAVPFHKTTSPSMDILVSSNLERHALSPLRRRRRLCRAADARSCRDEGRYQVSEDILARLQAVFGCGCCNDTGAAEVIGRLWREQKYLCDPHTAVAWSVAESHTRGEAPMVVLSTASPYKFPAAVLGALGEKTGDDEFAMMEKLHALTGTDIPANLRGLEGRPVRHRDVIDTGDMLNYVLSDVLK